jgi:hypothetical protein
MRVLITNLFVRGYSGSENVVELLADGLRRAGHEPTIYAPDLGEQADRMRSRGIRILDRIGELTEAPDIIHGQHLSPCLAAMARFPHAPVVFTSHSSFFAIEAPLLHPQIREYVAVDESCAAKSREKGVPEDRLSVILNAVDLARFVRRGALPAKPSKALLLTKNHGHREMVRSACAQIGLELDELGPGTGKVVPDLENRLGEYDLVFATARMALEAAATGCAVIVCDDRGFAGLLTSANLAAWRPLNFGIGILASPVTEEKLLAAIAQYDPADATLVTNFLRPDANPYRFVEAYVQTYRRAIGRPAPNSEDIARATAFWVEELSITTAERTWITVAREFGYCAPKPSSAAESLPAAIEESLPAAIEARLDTSSVKASREISRRLKQTFIPKFLRTKGEA